MAEEVQEQKQEQEQEPEQEKSTAQFLRSSAKIEVLNKYHVPEIQTYVTGYYFDVWIITIAGGKFWGANGQFSKVSGLGAEFEYDYYCEGGSNFHRAYFKGVKQQTLVLEQGAVVTGADQLSIAMEAINLGTEVNFQIEVMLMDHKGSTVRTWTIVGAHLIRYEGPALDANQSEIAVTRMEFTYNGAF